MIDEALRRAFEVAWFAGEEPDIADYLPATEIATFAGTLEELVSIDLEFRWKRSPGAGADASPRHSLVAGYCRRFPLLDETSVILRLLQEEFRLRSCWESPPGVEEYLHAFPEVLQDAATAGQLLKPCDSPPAAKAGAPGAAWGRYRLVRLHAKGAFGEVWEAHDPLLDRTVALKLLAPRYRASHVIRRRFSAEARTTARLQHPGIVSVHDFQEADDIPSYTMRLLGGETLASSIQRHHQRTAGGEHSVERLRLLTAFVSIVRTVEFAHAQGVIHRDLKPDNIILGEYGETAVLDWGLAKAHGRDDASEDTHEPGMADRGDSAQTRMGTVVGTPAYMSPEQAEGRVDAITEASDQFALGGILLEILTGRAPFPNGYTLERSWYPVATVKVPAPLLAICRKAMSHQPSERYPSVAELAEDLERYLADEPVSVHREHWQTLAARWVKRHRTLVSTTVVSAVVASVLLMIGFTLLLDANRRLARREQEAVSLRAAAEDSLEAAQDNLYGHRIALAHSEYFKNNIVRADELLKACPGDQRNWEWRHLSSLINQDRPDQFIAAHRAPILCAAMSADGNWIATGDSAGAVWLHAMDGATEPRRVQHGTQVRSVVFAGDGRHFYTGGADDGEDGRVGSIRRWSLASCQSVARLEAHGMRTTTLAWDGHHNVLFSSGADGRVTRRDATTLQVIEPTLKVDPAIRSVSVSTDAQGRWLVAAGDDRGLVHLWDVVSGQCLLTLRSGFGRVYDCALRWDGRALAAVGDGNWVMRWELQPASASTSFESDRLVAYPTSGTDWGVKQESLLLGHQDQVRAVEFAPAEDVLATAGFDRSVCFWWSKDTEPTRMLRSHTSHVRALAFGATGEVFATGSDDGCLRIWHHAPHRSSQRIQGYLTFARRGTVAAVQTADHLEVRDIAAKQRLWRIARGMYKGLVADFSPDGSQLATVDRDGSVVVWQVKDGIVVQEISSPSARACNVKFLRERSRLAVGYEDGDVTVWDTRGPTVVQRKEADQAALQLAVLPDDRSLIVGHASGIVRCWNLGLERPPIEFQADRHALFGLALHPDGEHLATTGRDGNVTLWEWRQARRVWMSNAGASWLNALVFTPDGQRLISGSEQTVTYWDVKSGQEIASLSVERCVHRLSFSADGDWLALSGEDPRVRLWRSL